MFIADLSYYNIGMEGSTLLNDAKLGILCGSIVAGVAGWLLLAAIFPDKTSKRTKRTCLKQQTYFFCVKTAFFFFY